uniref:Syntaxin-17 n=1 Tax=Cacopsylla melanoneura TaxID=428564 RepID=A0A8D8W7B3_9HEMI
MMDSKQGWKWIEPPLNTTKDLLIHHTTNLRKQKNTIIKEQRLQNWHAINQEQINASRTVKQLTATLKDLDNLLAKVQTNDLDKFRRSTGDVKRDAVNILKEYTDVENKMKLVREEFLSNSEDEEQKKIEEERRIQELALQVQVIKQENEQIQMVAEEMERLESDVQDVKEIFTHLGQLVHEQGESVNRIEDNIETAHENVKEGEKQLARAARYKASMYPLFGAIVGTCLGGPIGAVAGLKIGALSAVTGTVIGFTSGKMVKDKQGESISDQLVPVEPSVAITNV